MRLLQCLQEQQDIHSSNVATLTGTGQETDTSCGVETRCPVDVIPLFSSHSLHSSTKRLGICGSSTVFTSSRAVEICSLIIHAGCSRWPVLQLWGTPICQHAPPQSVTILTHLKCNHVCCSTWVTLGQTFWCSRMTRRQLMRSAHSTQQASWCHQGQVRCHRACS